MAKKLNVAMIGYGFMGRAHSNAYRKVSQFFDPGYQPVMKVVCARNQANVSQFARRWGWEEQETDWRRTVEREDVDLVDICSPNNTHLDIALAAARAGKMIACEKPLARNTAEAKKMTDAVEEAGLPNMIWFNYRRVPAVALARQVIEEGRLGRIFHYRAKYLQDWTISPDVPQGGACPVASGRRGCRKRSHRGLIGSLDRPVLMAQWSHRVCGCHDGDVHQAAAPAARSGNPCASRDR